MTQCNFFLVDVRGRFSYEPLRKGERWHSMALFPMHRVHMLAKTSPATNPWRRPLFEVEIVQRQNQSQWRQDIPSWHARFRRVGHSRLQWTLLTMPGIHAMHIEVVIAQVASKAHFSGPMTHDCLRRIWRFQIRSLGKTIMTNFRPATPVEIACSEHSGSLYQAMEALLQCDHLEEVLSSKRL